MWDIRILHCVQDDNSWEKATLMWPHLSKHSGDLLAKHSGDLFKISQAMFDIWLEITAFGPLIP